METTVESTTTRERRNSTRRDIYRYLQNWQSEVDSAAQYHALAEAEESGQLSQVYKNMAQVEEKHIDFWEGLLKKASVTIPERRPSWRSRVLMWLAKRFGPQLVVGTIAEQEKAGGSLYTRQKETQGTSMTAEEHWHMKVLKQIQKTNEPGAQGSLLARIEGRHKTVGGNTLRAAVLGANDGLCSNMSLVMGVAGASVNNHTLLVTGLAGLLAGACSMALGEWISVTSSRELAEREIQIETDEFENNPEGEKEELKLIYEAKGLDETQAENLARHMVSDRARAIEALTREELGIDPDDIVGSAGKAALSSFLLFAVGAVIPVVPFLFLSGQTALIVSVMFSAIGLFAFGAIITVFTGRPVYISGVRQMLLGLLAAAVTYSLGHWLGISVS